MMKRVVKIRMKKLYVVTIVLISMSLLCGCKSDNCENNPLITNPKYDTLIRVFITFKKSEELINVKAPNIETPKSVGLTVAEWVELI